MGCPCFALKGLLMDKDLEARRGHGCGIEVEGTMKGFVGRDLGVDLGGA